METSHLSQSWCTEISAGGNILFNDGTWGMVGVLDQQLCTIGDHALDFAEILYDFGERTTQRVLEKYRTCLDKGFYDRVRFYRSLEGVHNLLHGVRKDNALLIWKGKKEIEKDFSDL